MAIGFIKIGNIQYFPQKLQLTYDILYHHNFSTYVFLNNNSIFRIPNSSIFLIQ